MNERDRQCRAPLKMANIFTEFETFTINRKQKELKNEKTEIHID